LGKRYICIECRLTKVKNTYTFKKMKHPLTFFSFCPRCGFSGFSENDEKSKKCATCGFVFYLNASSAVAAIIINENNEMLLCRRACEPYKGTLDLPGGFVDLNESAEEALRREILEEIGTEVETMQYFGSFPNIYPFSGFEVHTLDMVFICTLKTDSILAPDDDVSEAMFIPFDKINLDEIKLPSIRKAVEKWLKFNR